MTRKLYFKESEAFYKSLDAAVEARESFTVSFADAQMDLDSPMMKRLARCRGFERVQAELEKLQRNEPSVANGMLSAGAAAMLTGPALYKLALFIASLLAGLTAFALYKNMNVRIKGSVGGQEVEIEFTPA